MSAWLQVVGEADKAWGALAVLAVNVIHAAGSRDDDSRGPAVARGQAATGLTDQLPGGRIGCGASASPSSMLRWARV